MTTGKTMEIDIGNLCTHCGKDTLELASSGMRIASGADAKLTLSDAEIDIVVNGWMCVECREIECDRCGKMSYEYEILDKPTPEVVCQHCMEEGGRMTTEKRRILDLFWKEMGGRSMTTDNPVTTCHICGMTSSDERRFTYGNKQDEEAITGDGSIRCGNCIDDDDREGGE